MLMRTASQSLTEQLAAHFAERIGDRLLAAGTRLPSVRQCAEQHGVSPATVVAAYDRLLAQGLVEARRNRGFFVREQRAAPPAAAATSPSLAAAPAWRRQVGAAALLRGMFQSGSQLPQPGIGVFPVDWLAGDIVAAGVRRVTAGQGLKALSLQYGDPSGDPALRRALSHKLADALSRARINPRDGLVPGPVTVVGYAEPSLVFLLGTGTEFGDVGDAAEAISEGRPVAVEARQDAAFQQELASDGLKASPVGVVRGLDYSLGRPEIIILYRSNSPPQTQASGPAQGGAP